MGDGASPLGHAEGQQLPVQVRQVIGPGHRGAGPPLQREHRSLHIALLLPFGRHAEQRVEPVVRRQGRIRRVQGSIPAAKNLDRHRPGIVPPDLPRHGPEELERPAHSLQDRFGPLAGQREQKRAIAVRPHPTEHVGRPPAIGKVHLHLSEVKLHPPARRMVQTHERLTVRLSQRGDVPPHRVITPLVPMLGFQPLVNAFGMMALLLRSRFILPQNLPDDRHERAELGIAHRLGPPIGQRLAGLRPDRTTDRLVAMTQAGSNRTNRFTRRVRFTNLKIIQHCEHPRFVITRPLIATRADKSAIQCGHFPRPSTRPRAGVLLAPSQPMPHSVWRWKGLGVPSRPSTRYRWRWSCGPWT